MQPEDIPRVELPVVAVYGHGREAEVLANQLTLDGYDVRSTNDLALLGEAEVVIFAQASQSGTGLRDLRALRQSALAGAGSRVLWVSMSTHLSDTVRAFEAGADDVIRHPIAYPELLARVRALLRRDPATPRVIEFLGLRIDTASRSVTFKSTPVELRAREYELLRYLARDPTRVYTRAELLRTVWGHWTTTTRTLDSHASRVRRALTGAGAVGWIGTARGVGYSLAPFGAHGEPPQA